MYWRGETVKWPNHHHQGEMKKGKLTAFQESIPQDHYRPKKMTSSQCLECTLIIISLLKRSYRRKGKGYTNRERRSTHKIATFLFEKKEKKRERGDQEKKNSWKRPLFVKRWRVHAWKRCSSTTNKQNSKKKNSSLKQHPHTFTRRTHSFCLKSHTHTTKEGREIKTRSGWNETQPKTENIWLNEMKDQKKRSHFSCKKEK